MSGLQGSPKNNKAKFGHKQFQEGKNLLFLKGVKVTQQNTIVKISLKYSFILFSLSL